MKTDAFDAFATSGKISTLYYTAVELQNSGKFHEALIEYKKILALNPKHWDAMNNMACALEDIGDPEQAFVLLERSLLVNPNNWMAYYNYGWILKKQENYLLSIQYYSKAIELSPLKIDAYLGRSTCYKRLGKFDSALNDLLTALDKHPNEKFVLNDLGCLYFDLKNYEKASYYYELAIEKHPDYYKSYYNRGIMYEKEKKHDLAIENYTKSIELDTQFINALDQRGWCYIKTKQYDEALADFSKLLDLNPKDTFYLEKRAKIFALKGDYRHAFADIKNAVKLHYTEYESKEMIAIVSYKKRDKIKNACKWLLNNGFYLNMTWNCREKTIVFPRLCKYRIVLRFPKLHVNKTLKRHLRQYAGRYELKFNSDFDTVFTRCQEHYKDDIIDIFYMENLRFLFSTMNKDNDYPKAVCVGLYLDGKLIAGDIGIQIGRVYTSYTGYHDMPSTGSVQLVMLARYLEENKIAFWDFGPDTTTRWETYKLKLGCEKMSNEDYHKLFRSVNPCME